MTPKFEIKKSQSCQGNEGIAWSCDLWINGKKAAAVNDDGNGGSVRFWWFDKNLEQLFIDHVKSLPREMPDETWREDERQLWPEGREVDMDCFIAKLVDDHENVKRLKRICKKKALFRVKGDPAGELRKTTIPYSPSLAKQIRAKYGDQLEYILNEQPEYQ